MADISKTIEIIFAGVDNLGPVTQNIGGGLSSVASGVQSATQPLADLSDSVLLTSAAITALGIAALTFATKEAVALENSFVELQKVLGDTDGQATDFADTFGNISNQFGVGQADVISLAADFKQAGFTIEESLGLVEQALTAAAISELGVDQAGDTVIRTLNGFQAPAAEAGRLIDILNNASNTSAVSFGELGIALARISPISQQLGFSFEETAGLLTPVIEVFGSGSEAANGLRTSLLKLGSDSKPVIDALESIGIDTTEVVSAKDRLQALSEVFPTLTDVQKTFVTQEIAGIEQAAKFSIVLSNQKAVLEATASAYQATGSAAAELEIALAKTEVAFQRFSNSIVNIAAAVGTEFLPQLGAVTNSATTLNEAILASLSGSNFEQVFNSLRGVFTALDTEIQGIAKAFPDAIEQVDFGPILAGLDSVQGALGSVFGDIDLTTPEGLASAIQFIVDTLGSLAQVTAGIISEFEGVFSVVGQSVGAFNDLTEAEQQAAGEALGFGKLLNSLGGILDTVGTALSGIGVALGVLAGTTGLSAVGGLFSKLTKGLGVFSAIGGTTAAASGVLGTAMGGLAAAVGALAIPVTLLIGLFAELNNQSISRFIDDVTDLSNKQKFAAEATDIYGKEIGDLAKQFQDGAITYKEYKKLTDEISDAQILATAATMENTAENKANVLSLLKTSDAIDTYKKSTEEASDSSVEFSESLDQVTVTSKDGLSDTFIADLTKAAEEFDKAGGSAKKASTDLVESTAVVDQFGNALTVAGEKANVAASGLDAIDGKTATVKVTAETQSAQQALEQFQSVLGSIDNTIANTGTSLTGLGSLLTGNFGISQLGTKALIQDAFEAETAARQKALDLQNELIETEIALQQARLAAVSDGDATITIDTAGLDPILDLLLTTIIQQAQVKASAEGAAFLAGAIT